MSARQAFVPQGQRAQSRATNRSDQHDVMHDDLQRQARSMQNRNGSAATNQPGKNNGFNALFKKDRNIDRVGEKMTNVEGNDIEGSHRRSFDEILRPEKITISTSNNMPILPPNSTAFRLSRVSSPQLNSAHIRTRNNEVSDAHSPPGSLSERGISVFGQTDAHIPTGGALNGFLTTSGFSDSAIVSPVPSYGNSSLVNIPAADAHEDHPRLPSGRLLALPMGPVDLHVAAAGNLLKARSRSRRSLDDIQEGRDDEGHERDRHEGHIDHDDAHHPIDSDNRPTLRRTKRCVQEYHSEDPNETEDYEVPFKRYKGDEPSRNDDSQMEFSPNEPLSGERPGNGQGQGNPSVTEPHNSANPPELGIEALFADISEDITVEMYEAEYKRWTECTTEEWVQGADELAAECTAILDWAKDHVMEQVRLYSRVEKRIENHEKRLGDGREILKDVQQSLNIDVLNKGKGKSK